MKKLLYFSALIIITLSSCQSYLLSTVSSTNMHKDEVTGIQSLENDSLIISYNFSGDNSPFQIEIYNKLSEPLFVNWERSALIVNKKAYSFVASDLKLDAVTSSSQDFIPNDFNYTSGNVSGNIKVSTKEGFVPPKSSISRKLSILNDIQLPPIEKSLFKPVTFNYIDGTGRVYAKEALFTEQNSPLKFKTYITLFTLKDNVPHLFNSQQDFFISNVTKSGASPKNLTEFGTDHADVITMRKPTGYGKVMTGVVVVSALGVAGATEAALDKNTKPR